MASPLSHAELERLRNQVIEFFTAYYQELRSQIERRDDPEAIPDYLKGYKRVAFQLGVDGAVIVHFPDEGAQQDTFVFEIIQDSLVKDIADRMKLETPEGYTVEPIDYELGTDFGAGSMFPLEYVVGNTLYRVNWSRLDYAHINHVFSAWQDVETAREQARQDLQP